MRRALAAAAVLAAATTTACGSKDAAETATPVPAPAVAVERGALSSRVSLSGTLTYRARTDGAPYAAINQARGIYTRLPAVGDKVDCGDVLYRVDDRPVLLLCGPVPAYRDLRRGDRGKDVRQLNRTLRGVRSNRFTANTRTALKRLQRATGAKATGTLALGGAVFLPRPARIAKVAAELGEQARPGAAIAQATSDTLEVQVQLEPTQRRQVKPRDRAQITLPDNTVAKGTVDRLGKIARTAGKDDGAASATIPVFIGLDEPKRARGLDQAPVQVEITTKGVQDALSVPVLALVGKAGGGFAVEVVRDGGRRELVAVELGLFDTNSGRVEVQGGVAEGDQVVVPST